MNRLFFTVLICCSWLVSFSQDINFNQWIQRVPASAKFTDPGYQVWCASMIKGEDNNYYLFYSRWPDSLIHNNWVTDSEVALAVAKNPLGPYKFLKVVLPKRSKKYWDADVTHNPTIHKFGKKYYLYYTGNYGTGEFWDNRNHQRIGVAVSKSILGPWKRPDKPLIDISPGYDSLMVANPAVTRLKNGKYAMVYKSVGHGPAPFGGKVSHRVAFSSKPDGKFKKLPEPIFMKESVKFAAEDPFIWIQNNKYWALVKDIQGSFTGQGLSVALFESDDAINWKPAKNVLASRIEIPWVSGIEKVTRLERPQLYFEKGIPKVFFAAVMDKQKKSFIVAIPLDINNK
ncbi:glycoside hydrolase family protein [Flavobacterium sp. FlaQc-48]|uniref:glycoside hydrolase family protein n=1 Tax=Flavobacterium sp. FlaQc-48 TaxID=3374181 RepID=UPI00375805DB